MSAPVHAQECSPFRVVLGEGNQVDKSVSTPSTGIVKDNWNTDFAVPENSSFSEYVATITSKSSKKGNYPVQMYLKYSDGTSGKVFDSNIELAPGEAREISGKPRVGQQPYQVNVRVGDVEAVGYSYRLSARGCQ
jgi:hypothetical protein